MLRWSRNTWRILAFIMILVVGFVAVAHSLVTHEHPHEVLPLGAYGILHGGLAEKNVPTLSAPLLFALFTNALLGALLATWLREYTRHSETRLTPLYPRLFARGIIHLNQR